MSFINDTFIYYVIYEVMLMLKRNFILKIWKLLFGKQYACSNKDLM